jgi:hypothetical protein
MTNQIITDNFYFKTGQPWSDIAAWGADPSNPSNDVLIQQAIDYMHTTYNGGVVFMPPGIFQITNTVNIKGAVRLIGSGRNGTFLSGFTTNVNALNFDTSCVRGCGLEHLTVQGYYNPNPALITTNAITVARNVPANISHVTSFYGSAGLFTQGIDSHCFDSWFNGCLDSVVSNGANWYNRCMFNGNGSFGSQRFAFWQGTGYPGATSQENHFQQCDFSGNFTNSLNIQNGYTGTASINIFNGCITSSPINISNNYFASFTGHEFGSSSFTLGGSGGTVSVVGSMGFGVTLNLPGPQFQKAANFNIT